MDCSPPGSSVHRILQAKLLEWVAISSCRGSSWPRDRIQSLVLAGRFFSPAVSGDQHKASKSSEKSSQRTMSLATENLTLSSPLSVFMWASHPAASKSSCCIHSSGSATWSDTWWRRVRVLKETWLAVNSTVPHSCSSCAGKINNSLHFFLSVPICV